MIGVAIVRYLLANDSSLIAAVPASRIMAGTLPLNTAVPAISVSESTFDERLNIAMSDMSVLQTSQVRITILTRTYPEQQPLLALVEAALDAVRGDVNGFDVDSILPDINGPDEYMAEDNIYYQNKIYTVRFTSDVV